MKPINQNLLIRYIAEDLPEREMNRIRGLIVSDRTWAETYQAILQGLLSAEENLKTVTHDIQPPPDYWSKFNPRLNERLERKQRRSRLFKRWSTLAAPALGLAALLLLFIRLSGDEATQPARRWMYSFSAEDSLESMLNSKTLSTDDFLNTISLSYGESGTIDDDWMNNLNEGTDSFIYEPAEEIQKLDKSGQDDFLKELSNTVFL